MQPEVWIGLAQVTPKEGVDILEDAPGAFVNVLALATTAHEHQAAAAQALAEVGLNLEAMEDAEPLRERTARTSVEPVLLNLAEEVRLAREVRFGTFHSYGVEE